MGRVCRQRPTMETQEVVPIESVHFIFELKVKRFQPPDVPLAVYRHEIRNRSIAIHPRNPPTRKAHEVKRERPSDLTAEEPDGCWIYLAVDAEGTLRFAVYEADEGSNAVALFERRVWTHTQLLQLVDVLTGELQG